MAETQSDLWIFAYGSLMWRPDFAYTERQRATLGGYRRTLCIRSHVYRGTVEQPGLVFGLDRGGSCTGVAFRIAPESVAAILAAVRLRELVLGVYHEIEPTVLLADGRSVSAIAYAADPAHEQYAGTLSVAAQRDIVRRARGDAGTNLDYVLNTKSHLDALGVADPELAALSAALTEG